MRSHRYSIPRSTSLRFALVVAIVVLPASVSRAYQEPESPPFVPLDLPAPQIDLRPEDAMPEGGERVLAALERATTSLRGVQSALSVVEDYVEDTWGARLERDIYPGLRALADGRAADDRLRAALREAASEAQAVSNRLRVAGEQMTSTMRELEAIRGLPVLDGSVLQTHLTEMLATVSTTEAGARAGAGARIEAAQRRAAELGARLTRSAERPTTADEAELRELAGSLRDLLDDIGEAVLPEPTEPQDRITFARADVIRRIFEIYSCGGEWVTIMGTSGDDVLQTHSDITNGDDVINGLGGNDRIYGDPIGNGSDNGGDDVICGGPGEDRLEGMAGNDRLYGGADNDIVSGWWDDDAVWGGPGDDFVYGLGGSDVAHGGPGNDQVRGDGQGAWKDWVFGDDGDDHVHGGGGDDQVYGGEGSDFIYGEGGNDWVLGGASNGDLWASGWSTPHTVVTGGPPEFFYECGGSDWDYLWGGEGDDHMYGEAGKDWLNGGPGDDEMHGDYVVSGGDSDCLWGGGGEDRMFGEDGSDAMLGGDDDDLMRGGPGGDTMFGEGGDDTVYGQGGADVVVGDYCVVQSSSLPGQDTLFGGASNDLLFGQEEDDSLDGGAGTDTCNGGSGTDTTANCETTIDVPPE